MADDPLEAIARALRAIDDRLETIEHRIALLPQRKCHCGGRLTMVAVTEEQGVLVCSACGVEAD